jgi:hypothetical protein
MYHLHVKKTGRISTKPPSLNRQPIKSSYDLAMERLRAADRASGTAEAPLSPAQKKDIAEARRVATSRLAEREILFKDAMRKTADPAEREKAEREYQIDRQRINDDLERTLESIRRPPVRGASSLPK